MKITQSFGQFYLTVPSTSPYFRHLSPQTQSFHLPDQSLFYLNSETFTAKSKYLPSSSTVIFTKSWNLSFWNCSLLESYYAQTWLDLKMTLHRYLVFLKIMATLFLTFHILNCSVSLQCITFLKCFLNDFFMKINSNKVRRLFYDFIGFEERHNSRLWTCLKVKFFYLHLLQLLII